MDRTLTSRFEIKYLVEPALVEPLRRFMCPFMSLDPYSARRASLKYPICSLYLDTPDAQLYHQTMAAEKNRFKLRVRCYSDAPEAPVFVEVKRKVELTVLKSRAILSREEFNEMLDSGRLPTLLADASQGTGLDEFRMLTQSGELRPLMRVRYQREAYESNCGAPVRITFDHDLGHVLTHDWNLQHRAIGWRDTRVDGVIFEIKFTDRFPRWIEEMVHAYELQRLSVPKYCMAVEQSMEDGRYNPSFGAGLPQMTTGLSL